MKANLSKGIETRQGFQMSPGPEDARLFLVIQHTCKSWDLSPSKATSACRSCH